MIFVIESEGVMGIPFCFPVCGGVCAQPVQSFFETGIVPFLILSFKEA
jgi:hypothetical protein